MPSKTQSREVSQPNSTVGSHASETPATSAVLSARYELFASFFEQLYLEKEVYAHEDRIVLRWPRKLEAPADYNARLQRTDGRIYAESEGKEGDGGDRTLAQAVSVPDGEYELILMPSANEYYVKGVRVQRRIPLSVVRSDYRTTPYGTYVERQIELLRHASALEDGLFSEIAKMTLGWWQRISTRRIIATVAGVEGYGDDHLARVVGLLGMIYRYSEHEAFPAELRQPLDNCIVGLAYEEAEYAEQAGRNISDTERLLLATCELLAGQRYADRAFSTSNLTGQQHRERAEEFVARWLRRAAADGFPDTSGHSLAQLLVALSHLIDLADSEPIWDLAGVLMDKTVATLALDSLQGVYGASQFDLSCPHPSYGNVPVRSAYASPLAGIARLLWGMGAWNWHLSGPVSLACCQGYEQPAPIAALASETHAGGMWASQRHVVRNARQEELGESDDLAQPTLHKAVYKTPDFQLASAQDFQPGRRGRGGHSWQATLGAEAIVFVHHPATEAADAQGNEYWRSGLLPRVAQHHGLLIALFSLPQTDRSGFTQAYFPTFAFDEHQVGVGNNWAFAAKGDAYIALGCSRPLELVQEGVGILKALRAYGNEAAWLCQMGRKADHGSLADFRKRILAARLDCDGLCVSYRPLQGDSVTFDWTGQLRINGEVHPLHNANHYNGPHCVTDGWPASQMVVVHGEQAIQLDFADG